MEYLVALEPDSGSSKSLLAVQPDGTVVPDLDLAKAVCDYVGEVLVGRFKPYDQPTHEWLKVNEAAMLGSLRKVEENVTSFITARAANAPEPSRVRVIGFRDCEAFSGVDHDPISPFLIILTLVEVPNPHEKVYLVDISDLPVSDQVGDRAVFSSKEAALNLATKAALIGFNCEETLEISSCPVDKLATLDAEVYWQVEVDAEGKILRNFAGVRLSLPEDMGPFAMKQPNGGYMGQGASVEEALLAIKNLKGGG